MVAEPLWQLDAVTLEPGRLRAITATISRGVTAVIGAEGAGKTSLLNLLAGFEKPTRGSVRPSPHVAWVPKSGGLWPHCTVLEHLEMVGAECSDAETLLAQFDLAPRREARPRELSESEVARLSVARALAADAEVLVMDEPLAPSDPAQIARYWNVIHQRRAARGASLIFPRTLPRR